MFRRNLPAGQGMLFVYPEPQPVSFWMRNTLIPLDLIFFDETGVIRHIHRNARPWTKRRSPAPRRRSASPTA